MNLPIRLLRGVVSLWLIVTLVFVCLRLTGDPVLAVVNPDDMTAEMLESYRQQWGYSGSILDQYVTYVLRVVQGDLGTSQISGKPAVTVVLERLPATLQLVAISTMLMVGIGVPLGTLAGMNPGGRLDTAIMAGSTVGFALPNFVLGIGLILVFSVMFRLLPSGGTGSVRHLILPALTVGLAKATIFTRFVRSAVLDAMKLPCVTSATARGLPPGQVFFRHILPNCMIPLVTMLPLLVGAMISAGAVVETVFAWPGIGRLVIDSVSQRDLAVLQATIMLVAFIMITTNLLVDIAYAWLDPRSTVRSAA